MLHPEVLRELLEAEIEMARERLVGRFLAISLDGSTVRCGFAANGVEYHLALDGRCYDAEPFRVAIVDGQGRPVSNEGWPPALTNGIHPVLGVPWACVQGTFEFHSYHGHHTDTWDAVRFTKRLPELLDHLLRRARA